MQIDGTGNTYSCGENVVLTGRITGHHNTVTVGPARVRSDIRVEIHGNNNWITISESYQIKGLVIHFGNHVPAHGTRLEIGPRFSIEPGGVFLLYNSGNRLRIGRDGLWSSDITVRCGDSPHLLFDLETGAYLGGSEGVLIGDHVWVGERVYITKRVAVPDDTVIAACSVVTRRFSESNTVIGGNPAEVVKRNVQWIRNSDFIERNSIYARGFQEYQAAHAHLARVDPPEVAGDGDAAA